MKFTLGRAFVLLGCVVAGTAESAVRYVWKDNPNTPVPPYTGGWTSAATTLQSAVDVAVSGDTVLVTNGIYNVGGRVAPGDTTLNTRVVITNAIKVVSVNGPAGTLIVGAASGTANGLGSGAWRCVYLTNNAVLAGFTVTNGFTLSGTTTTNGYSGGGIRAESASALITNCVVTANGAAVRGGGVHQGTLIDCVVISNFVAGGTTLAGGGGVYGANAWNTRIERNRASGTSNDGGGAYGGALVGCTVVSNAAGRDGGGLYSSTFVSNCVVVGNSGTRNGGGMYLGVALDSRIASNRVTASTSYGGGYYGATAGSDRLVGCSVVANSAVTSGGGVYNAVLSNCVVQANRAVGNSATTGQGGGYFASTATGYLVYRSVFLNNEATYRGGGAYQGKFYGCVFSGNRAAEAGGAYLVNTTYQLNSCTVMGNSATNQYGGTYSGTVSNSIIYANTALAHTNLNPGVGNYYRTCADPQPTTGSGNTGLDPQVSGYGDPHLLPLSPCIGTGALSAWMTDATDLDGDARVAGGLTDMGADQWSGSAIAGPLAVEILGETTCVAGYPASLRAECTGRVGGLVWNFGDGSGKVTNDCSVTHAYSAVGNYEVTVTASNATGSVLGAVWLHVVEPPVYYVSLSGSHEAPFNSWQKAATNIQDAVDAAIPGGIVLVTNGVYRYGGRVATSQTVLNRVCVDRVLIVRSVGGPDVTAIVGKATPATGVGASAERGVYLAEGASLCGFTVSNGFTRAGTTASDDLFGGGVWCASAGSTVSNCVVFANAAALRGGGVYRGTLYGSQVSLNMVTNNLGNGYGGGVAAVSAFNSLIVSNRTEGSSCDGGGAGNSQLFGCELSGNTAVRFGGGAYDTLLSNCVVRANRVTGYSAITGLGGGSYAGATTVLAYNTRFLDNVANYRGGGAYQGQYFGCVFSGNRAAQGGGAYLGGPAYQLNSCTVMGNSATNQYGGVYFCTVSNSVIVANSAPASPNYSSSGTYAYTCADPAPAGTGNFDANPQVSGYADPHLLAGSPCIGAGAVSGWMAGANDLDGEARAVGGVTDIGADQYAASGLLGPLSVSLAAATNVCVAGWPHAFRAEATGRVGGIVWSFGDGAGAAGMNPGERAYAAPGTYTVTVTVTNGTHTASASYQVTVVEETHYVSPSGGHVAPFSTWATAATNIQAAVDAVVMTGGRVLVTNGIYSAGGSLVIGQTVTNRLVLNKAVNVVSVNGPEATAIVGRWHNEATPLGTSAIRGVYIGSTAVLSGFAVSNGATLSATSSSGYGGGLFLAEGGVVTNCVISGCRGYTGAGAASDAGLAGTLRECTLSGNAGVLVSSSNRGGGAAYLALVGCNVISNAAYQGGGAYDSVLTDCELRGNVAAGSHGGGVYYGTLSRCRLYDNSATGAGSGGGAYDATLYSCVLAGNIAYQGGGVCGATVSKGMFNCTVGGNTATVAGPTPGGGGFYCANTNYTVRNCIVYDNTAAVSNNVNEGTVRFSCVAPLQAGEGNISEPPRLASFESPVLLPGSPCVGAGLAEAWMAGASDFEGEPRMTGGAVDIGADQVQAEAADDPLTAAISAPAWPYYPGTGYGFEAVVSGHPTGVYWDFGDGQGAVDAALATHAWAAEGRYTLRLTVSNATHSAEATIILDVAPDTRYVSPTGSHTSPFLTWATAATNLQSAADVVTTGGRIKVAAGTYNQGTRLASGESLANRLLVTNAVSVIAVDGPGVTFIVGVSAGSPVTNGLGAGAVRGVRLAPGASLRGFTVTGGRTLWSTTSTTADYNGGGVYCATGTCVVSDCVVTNCAAAAQGGGVFQGSLVGSTLACNAVCALGAEIGLGGGTCNATLISNCVLRANASRSSGGGAYVKALGLVVDSVFDGNRSSNNGGGFSGSSTNDVLRRCVVVNNTCSSSGGGVSGATLYDCLLTNNAALNGGGCYVFPAAAAYRCRLIGNRATYQGGGAYGFYLYSCVVSGNSAASSAGGTYSGLLESCTVVNNRAPNGSGTYYGTAYNCILFDNGTSEWDAYYATSFTGCWMTAPNLTGLLDPHLLPGSPCIDAGIYRAWMGEAEGLDMDGEARQAGAAPDVGADEFDATLLTGPLTVTLTVDQSAFAVSYHPEFHAEAAGLVGEMRWDFGDETGVTNQNPVRHAFSGVGNFVVRVTVSNLTHVAFAELTVTVVDGRVYVAPNGGHVAPFATWETAATNLQDAVDAAVYGGTVWVTNGVYAAGGHPAAGCVLTNRVCVEKPVAVRSVQGPAQTVIQGQWHSATQACGAAAVRGVWLGNGASLSGFCVTNGATLASSEPYGFEYGGGGVCALAGESVSNCWVTGCMADGYGGGVYGGNVQNSAIRSNHARWGGGAYNATITDGAVLDNASGGDGAGVMYGTAARCLIAGNVSLGSGGGSCGGSLSDCTLVGNTAHGDGGGAYHGNLTGCTLDGNESTFGSGGGFAAVDGDQRLDRCVIVNNTAASASGGGCYGGLLYDCLLTNNAALNGGGVSYGVLFRCRVWDNRASDHGGGAFGGTLTSCVVAGNRAALNGGGTYAATLESCSVLGNSAGPSAGGCYQGYAYNSIVYYNRCAEAVGADAVDTVCENCCIPGVGSVASPPQVSGFYEPHLLPSSPCLDAGASRDWMAAGDASDLDGEPRVSPLGVDIGADEVTLENRGSLLTVRIVAESAVLTTGQEQVFRAEVGGVPSGLTWNFGDESSADNQNPLSHAYALGGVYTVRATATNEFDSVYAEFQVVVGAAGANAALGTPLAWLDGYRLGPDYDAAELADPDGDGVPTWQEYVALTSPTDGTSFFVIRQAVYAAGGLEVSFDTEVGRVYTVQHSEGLTPVLWSDAATPVSGTGARLAVTVSDSGLQYFYRVRVSLP